MTPLAQEPEAGRHATGDRARGSGGAGRAFMAARRPVRKSCTGQSRRRASAHSSRRG